MTVFASLFFISAINKDHAFGRDAEISTVPSYSLTDDV